MKDKTTAALLALFLGGIGAHKFYLGQTVLGILYLLFCWTFIPACIAFLEFIILLCTSREAFDARFNRGLTLATQPQNIVVSVQQHAYPQPSPAFEAPYGQQHLAMAAGSDVASQIKQLHDLRVAGVLTDDEFIGQKQRLLAPR